jgi:hypothetical protein
VIILGSLVAIGFGGVPQRRTQLGSEILEHLQGLREYLQLAEADRLRVLQSPQVRSAAGSIRTMTTRSSSSTRAAPLGDVWGVEKQWQDVLGQRYAQTQTEPTNLQSRAASPGLNGFATTATTSGFAQTVSTSSYSSSGGGSSFSGGSSGGGFSGGGGRPAGAAGDVDLTGGLRRLGESLRA